MKLRIFYSWQSDLPNNKNRGLIERCLKQALKSVYENNDDITEYTIESDSREESGTPDIVASIFEKIDSCDVFVGDISIINSQAEERKVPNPNVLFELGYATKSIGWENVICVFNGEFGEIEELPFDIRSRKPLYYKSNNVDSNYKEKLEKQLIASLSAIIKNRLEHKKYYGETKLEIDSGMQAVLIDLGKLIYLHDDQSIKKYDYSLMLRHTVSEISDELKKQKFLGFQIYRDWGQSITDFSELLNDNVSTFFLNDVEKEAITKMIYCLKRLKKQMDDEETFIKIGDASTRFAVASAYEMNTSNPQDSYILFEKINNESGNVMDSSLFKVSNLSKLVELYSVNPNRCDLLTRTIYELKETINDWIKKTGNQFIRNHRRVERSIEK